MSSKNEILNRLRQGQNSNQDDNIISWKDNDIFADYPGQSDRLLDIFKNQLTKLSGDIYIVNNKIEAVKKLQSLMENIHPSLCISHKDPLIEELKKIDPEIGVYLSFIEEKSLSSEEYAAFQVGISGADCLIARTGSILLRAVSAGGRRLSVLPPIHIVIAEEKQIVASLDAALNVLDLNQDAGSFATIISGPSRTSDIEKQLVLGAHGPKRLIVLIIKS